MLPSRRARWFYWGGLTILNTILILARRQVFLDGTAASSDLVILVVWLALLLAPLFQAVELFGLKFQHQIDELKQDVARQLSVFRTEITTTMSSNSIASSAVTLYPQLTTEQLETLARRLASESTAQREKKDIGGFIEVLKRRPDVPPQVSEMFAFRYSLEGKVNRILSLLHSSHTSRQARQRPVVSLAGELAARDLLSAIEAQALPAMWGITSQAIHGRPVSSDELEFVRETFPAISEALDQVATELEQEEPPSSHEDE